jgi:hypothetical protein
MAVRYIYVLTNPAMPGMVKVGYTQDKTPVRAQQIFTTGVPKPFQIEFFQLTENVEAVESAVHQALASKRVNRGREFFAVEIAEAVQVIEQHVRDPETRFIREPLKVATAAPTHRDCKRCGRLYPIAVEYCPKCFPV